MLTISLSALKCIEQPACLWRVPGLPLALLGPPVWTDDSYLACLHAAGQAPASPMLGMAWLKLDGANPRKVETLAVPSLGGLTKCTGETTDGGLVGNRFGLGLSETFIQSGLDEDLSPED